MTQLNNDNIRKSVRTQYAQVAVSEGSGCGCATTNCCTYSSNSQATAIDLGYTASELDQIPEGANMGLGCGNPQAIASLQLGETVLDLGSGGGFDCFLAAKAVGTNGRVIGVDMTPEMVSKARANAEQSGHENVDFRLGEIEHLPVADEEIDVIISNCVINLSPEKSAVFKEAYRVLKVGGRLAISDIVATATLPASAQKELTLWNNCLSGASSIKEIETMLQDTGFEAITIKPKEQSREFIQNWVPGSQLEDYVVSASIEALKL